DDVKPAVRGERADQRVPIELHVDGADHEVEAAAEFLDRRRVFGRDGMVRSETFSFCEFALTRGECGHVAAVRGSELYGHVPKSAYADDADPIGWLGVPDQRREDGDAAAKQRPRIGECQFFRQRKGPGPVRANMAREPAAMTNDGCLRLRAQ